MKIRPSLPIILLPLLIAAKSDPLRTVNEPDRTLLAQGLQRYAKDQIGQDWADSYEIADQDVAMKRDLLVPDDAPPVSRERFIEGMKNAIASGGTPVLKSFELTEVRPTSEGYDIRACSRGERERFHYKGIIQLHAVIRDKTARFGSWSFVFYSPHSCDQKEDNPM